MPQFNEQPGNDPDSPGSVNQVTFIKPGPVQVYSSTLQQVTKRTLQSALGVLQNIPTDLNITHS